MSHVLPRVALLDGLEVVFRDASTEIAGFVRTEDLEAARLSSRLLRVLPTRSDHWYAAGSPVEYLNAA